MQAFFSPDTEKSFFIYLKTGETYYKNWNKYEFYSYY